MTFKVSDNQYGRFHPSDSWAFCLHYCSYQPLWILIL